MAIAMELKNDEIMAQNVQFAGKRRSMNEFTT